MFLGILTCSVEELVFQDSTNVFFFFFCFLGNKKRIICFNGNVMLKTAFCVVASLNLKRVFLSSKKLNQNNKKKKKEFAAIVSKFLKKEM